jgi:rRNA maturation endonuclease Nob1
MKIKYLKFKKQCTQCDKFFQTRNSRRKHIATIHAPKKQKTEEAVICEICGKSFRTKPIKQLHLDTHIDGKTFPVSYESAFRLV